MREKMGISIRSMICLGAVLAVFSSINGLASSPPPAGTIECPCWNFACSGDSFLLGLLGEDTKADDGDGADQTECREFGDPDGGDGFRTYVDTLETRSNGGTFAKLAVIVSDDFRGSGEPLYQCNACPDGNTENPQADCTIFSSTFPGPGIDGSLTKEQAIRCLEGLNTFLTQHPDIDPAQCVVVP